MQEPDLSGAQSDGEKLFESRAGKGLFGDFENDILSKFDQKKQGTGERKTYDKEWNLEGAFAERQKPDSISKFFSLKEKILLLKQEEEGVRLTTTSEAKKNSTHTDYNFKGQAKEFYREKDLISFDEFGLSRPLLKACRELDYDHPTPIQRKAIPLVLSGKDVLGTAATGSGKTACFLLPVVELLLRARKQKARLARTRVLILIPARELAAQCHAMLEHLLQFLPGVSSALIIGGADMKRQESMLRARPDIVVATPGRLLDHATNTRSIELSEVRYLVLDEADKLLEMGFKEKMEELVKSCTNKKQTLLFSATLSSSVTDLASMALNNPAKINTATTEKKQMKLQQYLVRLKLENQEKEAEQEEEDTDEEEKEKKDKKSKEGWKREETSAEKKSRQQREATLIGLCKRHFRKRVIVFFNTCAECHRMLGLFTFMGLGAQQVHGQMEQKQRLEAVGRFQSGQVEFLLATDLLARGLDIHDVKAVINFRFPRELARYTHRIGRTARAGEAGIAVTICDEDERKLLRKVSQREAQTYSVQMKWIEEQSREIKKIEAKLEGLLAREKEELEIRKTEVELTRAENLIKHKAEIQSRPKKEWFQSKQQRKEIKEASREAVQKNFQKVLAESKKAPKKHMIKREVKSKQKEQQKRAKDYRDQKAAKREFKRKGDKPGAQKQQKGGKSGAGGGGKGSGAFSRDKK